MTQRRKGRGPGREAGGSPEAILAGVERAAVAADRVLVGPPTPELDGREHLASVVRTVARRVGATQARLSGGPILETLARLKQDSLLNTPVKDDSAVSAMDAAKISSGGKKLSDALNEVEAGLINDIFFSEKDRIEDYETFSQIYDLITLCAEAAQTYCDSIISPDDWTKRDITIFYEGVGVHDLEVTEAIQKRCLELTERYGLDDKLESAITTALIRGDYFIAAFNLRQELEGVLAEGAGSAVVPLSEQDVPDLTDPDMQELMWLAEADQRPALAGTLRSDLADYINGLVVVHEDARTVVRKEADARSAVLAREAEARVASLSGRKLADPTGKAPAKRRPSLAGGGVRGSIVKLIPPENVVKLSQGDTLFGYYFIELHGPNIADFGRRGSQDQTAVVRAIDRNLSARFLSPNQSGPENAKDKLIGRVIAKTLAAKLGNVAFLKDNEQFAQDAYAILHRAKREGRRLTISYVAPDQMVHFTPNGSAGYGESVLSRVKFMAKLYIGAITNAFMRNSIRRPERLVWYLDVGVDNDANNAIQNFIRMIKQREVKFSNLKDISTTINHIGEFHDFYVPTYNGERPVEVETLNMGAAAEVDSPFLEFLRKSIVAGMGVPAAFVGYSEEVAFAHSLTMDNGRFLRRVVRHQKHFGRAASRLMRILYRNEYFDLDEIMGTTKVAEDGKDAKTAESKKDATASADSTTEELHQLDLGRLHVRFPSPATLNMTNLSDAVNQSQPVLEFITDMVAGEELTSVKSALKAMVAGDLLPQIHWGRYREMLEDAKTTAMRALVAKVGGAGAEDSTPEGGEPSANGLGDGAPVF